MRRILRFLLLTFSLAVAIVATGFHRPIHAFDPLRRYTHTQFPLESFTVSLGLNDFGGFSFSLTHHLTTPLPWPATITPRPGISTPRELVIALHSQSGFTYARVDAAAAPFAPLDSIARILVLPYWFLLLLSLAFPLFWPITRRIRAFHRAHPLCPTCAYDLRAHCPGDRCPECGTPVSLPSAPSDPPLAITGATPNS